MTNFDDYDGPLAPPRRVCTCAGTAPGYPQHEPGCGDPDPDEDGPLDEDDDPGGGFLTCEQCGCTTSELYDSENYGLLCSRCAFRQEEHGQPTRVV